MKIQGKNPETGEKFSAENHTINQDFVESLLNFDMSDDAVKKLIDNLDVSADVKLLLFSFSKATIQIGEYIIKIGRKIIDYVCLLYQEYPSVTFGIIFGAIAGFLISAIPVIGFVLGPIFTPIAVAIGLVGGLHNDLMDKRLERKIKEINASFLPLGA